MKHRMFTLLVVGLAVFGLGLAANTFTATLGTGLSTIEIASAEEDAEDKPVIKGSVSKGKYYFKKNCKSCHGPEDEGGEVTPVSKTIKQWTRVFDKDRHYKSGEGDAKVVHKLSEISDDKKFDEMLIHIRTFLINHAADSDQPETCG